MKFQVTIFFVVALIGATSAQGLFGFLNRLPGARSSNIPSLNMPGAQAAPAVPNMQNMPSFPNMQNMPSVGNLRNSFTNLFSQTTATLMHIQAALRSDLNSLNSRLEQAGLSRTVKEQISALNQALQRLFHTASSLSSRPLMDTLNQVANELASLYPTISQGVSAIVNSGLQFGHVLPETYQALVNELPNGIKADLTSIFSAAGLNHMFGNSLGGSLNGILGMANSVGGSLGGSLGMPGVGFSFG